MTVPRVVVLQRALGLVLAAVLAVLAVYAFRQPAPATSTPLPQDQSPVTAVLPPDTASTPVPTTSGGAETTGPGLTEPGIHVVAQPDANGSLEVFERVRLRAPVRSLVIATPHPQGPSFAGVTPTITGFQAQADGLVVADTPGPSVTAAGGDQLDLGGPASEIAMRYRLDGATGRSQPAPVGRVLIVLPPVTADPSLRDLPVVVEVIGSTVRNLVCPNQPVDQQLCGRQNGRVWSTTAIPLSRALVIAQVDLPQPGAR